jgi:glycosyltransferase involved in cell wall biosynthesis
MASHPPERIAFLGGSPPRLCGIATFTHDLCQAVAEAAPGAQCFVGAMNDRPEGYAYPPGVRFEVDEKELPSYRRAADLLNFSNADVLCVQHEFGIYGGPAGSHLMTLLKEVRMPVVTTLHTVLRDPDPAQRKVMEELIRRSARLVVMADQGADLLRNVYGAPDGKVEVIPHGIPDRPFRPSSSNKQQFGLEGRKVLLTFGLLGPGKGLEYAIQALPELVRRHPDVVYVILGATHPHLLARDGETYRLGLERLAEDLGVKEHVIFYNRFVSPEDLKDFIGATDLYLTPYLNEAQITSGTLATAFGAGKAVISTPYWHAQELLADGRGTLVPFRDAHAIAAAASAYLDVPELMQRTGEKAYQLGRAMIWPAVAGRYLECFQRARSEHQPPPRAAFAGWTLASRASELPPLRLDHIERMSNSTGMIQHATYNVPNFQEGYCIDDNARAFLLCNLLDELGGRPPSANLDRLATNYLAFICAALNRDTGHFRNFMSHGHLWLEDAGSEDSHGRALWALGTAASRSRNEGHRKLSTHLFEQGLPAVVDFIAPRSWVFTLLGLHEYLRRFPLDAGAKALRATLTQRLVDLWHGYATDTWPWFEATATYENARFSQALLLSGQWQPNPEALAIGLKSLAWLNAVQLAPGGHFRPIGSNGFYPRDGVRADFDQQPVEAQAMVSACLEAFRATQDPAWAKAAKRTFEWFLGRNDLGQPLYDSGSGGCSDGLHHDRINENQGAESTLAFHLSLAEMTFAEHLITPASAPGG